MTLHQDITELAERFEAMTPDSNQLVATHFPAYVSGLLRGILSKYPQPGQGINIGQMSNIWIDGKQVVPDNTAKEPE